MLTSNAEMMVWVDYFYLLEKQCNNNNRNLRQKVSPSLGDTKCIKLPLSN